MAFVDGIKKFFSITHSPVGQMGKRIMGVIGASSSLVNREYDYLNEANFNSRLGSPIHIMASDVAVNDSYLTKRNKDRDFEPHVPTPASSAEMLEDLWENPCPHLSQYDLLYWSQGCYETVGRFYWRLIDLDEYGRPKEIWPLPPHWIIEEPSASNGGMFYTHWWTSEQPIYIPAAEIFEKKRPSWQNPIMGAVGQAQGVDDELAQDKAMAIYNTMYFENFACLGVIMGVPGYADDPEAVEDSIKKARVGAGNAFKTLIFDSMAGNVSASNLSPAMKDLNFAEGRESIRDFLLQAWQIPAARAGTLKNATRDDVEGADFAHSKFNVLPRLTNLYQEVDRKLTALFDDRNKRIPYRTRKRIGRLYIMFANPVRKTNKDLLEETKEGVRSCWITRNEARTRHGHKPRGTDVYIVMKNNIALIPADSDDPSLLISNDDLEGTQDEDRSDDDNNEGDEEDT